jgi:hypothetical protein
MARLTAWQEGAFFMIRTTFPIPLCDYSFISIGGMDAVARSTLRYQPDEY